MKKLIKDLYYKNDNFYILIEPLKRIVDKIKSKLIKDKDFIQKAFLKNLGYELNLDNPQTLNEKIQWLKFYDKKDLLTICSDKLKVREYVKNKIGEEYLIPLYFYTDDVNKISQNNIPDKKCVIKTNHDSGRVTIVKDKSQINWKLLRKVLDTKMKSNFYYRGREPQYKNIKPYIIVEELLQDNGKVPKDYKIHCFNGKVQFTQVDSDRFVDHYRNLYDTDWNLMECQWMYKKGPVDKKPFLYDNMIEIAEIFANDFDYVRVDLYLLENKIYFGELTFHPGSGWEPFIPKSYDLEFGKRLKLGIK